MSAEPESVETPSRTPARRRTFLSDTSRISVSRSAVESAIAFAFYFLLTFAFLPAARDSGQSFYQDVLVNGIGPDRAAAADFIKHGIFPSWSRDLYGGSPFAANIQHAVFYPFNFPFLIWDTATALKIVVLSTIAISGTATFLYCRHALRTSRLAALFAGLAFAFGGMSLQHVILTNQLQEISIMPLVLLATHYTLAQGRLRHVVLLGVTSGVQLLAGHPEEWVYTLLAVGIYTLCWALAGSRSAPVRLSLKRAARGVVRIGSGIGLMVLLFGFQLLPTLQLKSEGYRSSSAFTDQFPLPRKVALNALLPDYGNVLLGENVGYIGVVGLVLAAFGVMARRKGLRWVQTFAVVVSAFGFIMALGNSEPLARVVFDNVSILRSFRVPSRYLLLPSFALATMAALGMDSLLFRALGINRAVFRHRLRQVVLATAFLLAVGAFALTVGGGKWSSDSFPKWLGAALIVYLCWFAAAIPWVPRLVLAVALFATSGVELYKSRRLAEFHQKTPNLTYNTVGPVLEHLKAEGGRYVTSSDIPQTPVQFQSTVDLIPPQITVLRQRFYFLTAYQLRLIGRPNTQVQNHVETVLGRDGGLLPLTRWKEFFDARIGAGGLVIQGIYLSNPSIWNFNTLDFLGVRNFVIGQSVPSEVAVLNSHGFVRTEKAGYVQVFTRPAPPIARLTTDITVQPDEAKRIAGLTKLDLTKQAVVERAVPGVDVNPAPAGSVDGFQVGLTSVAMTSHATRPALLVLADPWYPGWKVSIDGKSRPMVRADHAFRGVVVPAGTHSVVFHYVDSRMELGFLLSGLTILGLVSATVVTRRRSAQDPATW